MSRRLMALLAGILTLGLLALPVAASPFEPPRDQWYAENDTGHWGDGDRVRIDEACVGAEDEVACSLQAFQERPFVVIAFVDTGINPYHADFRAPEFTHHPATYLEGYPAGAQRIDVSLEVADADGYAEARTADDGLWQDLRSNRLYWIPGTRVVGAYSVAAGGSSSGLPERVVLDDTGHGTGVASVAAGRYYGANPNALIVAVEGLGDAALTWATSQPWIDIVSNSWGPGLPGRVSTGSVENTREAARRGQQVLFSSGNGMRNTNSSEVFPAEVDPCRCKIPGHNLSVTAHNGAPSWVMSVGAASPVNGQAHWWHGIPVDVVSFGSKWAAAAVDGVQPEERRDFGGTSCATPITAGVLSAVIEQARDVLGDSHSGQRPDRPGVVAEAPPGTATPSQGLLSGGVLHRDEARDIVERSAQPVAFDAEAATWDYAIEPTTETYYVAQGYGLVDRDAKARALAALLGEEQLPERADATAWQQQMNLARDAIYGAP